MGKLDDLVFQVAVIAGYLNAAVLARVDVLEVVVLEDTDLNYRPVSVQLQKQVFVDLAGRVHGDC